MMSDMSKPIFVASIAKNEEKYVKTWAESAKGADGIFLLDTGSTDNTVSIAKECGITVFEQTFNPWHFANARNHLLDLLPDVDAWIINLDLDEQLLGDWNTALKNAPDWATRVRYSYTWNWLEDGSPGLVYHGDKIVRRQMFRWKGACHEVNVQTSGEERHHFTNEFQIHHFPDQTKSRSSYLPLLLQDIQDDPENGRQTYYTARELFFNNRYEEATKLFERHLVMKDSNWNAERAYSMRFLAIMHPHKAEFWLLRACAEYSEGREPWLDLAQHCFDTSKWEGCYWAAKRTLAITERGSLYLNEAKSWGYLPHDLAAISAYRLGLYEEAIKHGFDALNFHPEDKRLLDNQYWYESANTCVNVVIPTKSNFDGLIALLRDLSTDKKVGKICVVADGAGVSKNLLNLPYDVQANESIQFITGEQGKGIQYLWNLGINTVGRKNHIAFLNDDVRLDGSCISSLCETLDRNKNIGLVCPNYTEIKMTEDRQVFDTCRSRYDGTGGMAGFAMVLRSELVKAWSFDEGYKWWYGDDDLVNWVNYDTPYQTFISHKAHCIHADSVTIKTNKPENFEQLVDEDKKRFIMKWGEKYA
jgi:glycosyltransferase involved in cell wall biosynthesis